MSNNQMSNNQMGDNQWWNDFWTKNPGASESSKNHEPTWDGLCWIAQTQFWEEVFGQFASGREMLECGSGTARVSRHFARHGFNCTMLDYSEEGLRLGQNAFQSEKLPGRFIVGDINNIPFPANTFDVVFSGGVLELFDNVSRPIQEMTRVLKPGGLFAANLVPRKLSIQTIAECERTLVHSARNLARGRFRDAVRVTRFPPDGYYISRATLADYVETCRRAGLESVVGLGTSPFPALALPAAARRFYARRMKALMPWWRRFNHSQSKWTEWWGITYAIYGIKRDSVKS